jgi:hypothetical protein
MDTETKTCSKCGEVKPVDDFYKDKRRKDGLSSNCKDCCKASSTRWRKLNPSKVKAIKQRSNSLNKEKLSASHKKWMQLNADHVKSYAIDWRKRNPSKLNAQQKRNYIKNRDAVIARSLKWMKENPQKRRLMKKHHVSILKEWYVRQLLSKSEAPQSLIDLKREQVATLREVKRLIAALKEKQND